MIMLFWDEYDKSRFWEIYFDEVNKEFIINSGIVGEKGTSYSEKKSFLTPVNGYMRKLAEEQVQKGYRYVDEDSLKELVIHMPINNTTYSKDNLQNRITIADSITQMLKESHNGYSNAEDSRAESVNIYCAVLNINAAVQTIVNGLQNLGFLDRVVIGHFAGNDKYISDYPEIGKIIDLK